MPSMISLVLTPVLPPLLIAFSFPLILFAALTTSLAFAALLLRVSLLYCELGGALVCSWFFTASTKGRSNLVEEEDGRGGSRLHTSHSNGSLAQHRVRSSSIASSASQDFQQHLTTGGSNNFYNNYENPRNDSFASLLGAGVQGFTRDYEGIGGWRDEDDDPDREAIWLGMNRRLELPASSPPSRRHRRSYTGSSQISLPGQIRPDNRRWSGAGSPEALRMSPVQSRARTPSVTEKTLFGEAEDGGYFEIQPHPGPAHAKGGGGGGGTGPVDANQTTKTAAKESRGKNGGDGKDEKESRRKSTSGDSINSLASRERSRETTKRVRYV